MLDRKITFGRSTEVCRVIVKQGAANELDSILRAISSESRYLIADKNVERLHRPFFDRALDSAFTRSRLLTLPAGETTKNPKTQLQIHEWLLKNGASRASLVVGVGGGVICDLAGFAAATFMRGIQHAFVPTTLVAQIDAAIGGKNGINLPSAKNMVGTVKQPKFVIVDPAFLCTLPAERLREGMAELLKIALVRSKQLGKQLDGMLSSGNPEEQARALAKSTELGVSLKLDIVRKDPLEKGLREILNFGHTTGHALEALGQYGRGIPHGKAVAFGILVAVSLSRKLCGLDGDTIEWTQGRIRSIYRSFRIPDARPDDVWKIASHDKKRTRDDVNFVLLEGFARPVVRPVSKRQFISSFAEVAKDWSGGR